MAEAKAVARFVRVPAQKARIVADLIRGKDVNTALVQVQVTKASGGAYRGKSPALAMANATQNHGVRDVDRLVVAEVYVNEGPTIKRIQPRAMGRAFRSGSGAATSPSCCKSAGKLARGRGPSGVEGCDRGLDEGGRRGQKTHPLGFRLGVIKTCALRRALSDLIHARV